MFDKAIVSMPCGLAREFFKKTRQPYPAIIAVETKSMGTLSCGTVGETLAPAFTGKRAGLHFGGHDEVIGTRRLAAFRLANQVGCQK